MFSLNEESLANHLGERKVRLEQDDIDRMQKEKAKELEAIEAAKKDDASEMDMSDIQIV